MKFIIEIRNRFFCILLNWVYLLNILYYYKETVLFLFLKQFVFKNAFNFYFLCTNITELVLIYVQLIKFFSLQINLIFTAYQGFLFILPALNKFEFFRIKHFLYFALIFNILSASFIINIFFPFLLNFLLKFQESFVYLELKPTEFFVMYKKVYLYAQLQFFLFLFVIYFFVQISLSIKKYRKVYYFLSLVLITLFFNFEAFFIVFFIFILFFELLLICIILNDKLV